MDKNKIGDKCVALEFGNSFGVKNISSHTRKTRSWYLLNSSQKRPNAFLYESSLPGENDLYIFQVVLLSLLLFCLTVLRFGSIQDAFVRCKNDFHLYVIAPLNV